MSMTKIFRLLLTLILCCGLMSGCNEKENNQITSSDNESEVTQNDTQTNKTDNSSSEEHSKPVDLSETNDLIDDVLKSLSDLDEIDSSLDTLSEDDLLVQ